ncbi:hypothetical protein [Tumebacillus flagellatus]|uniref:Uncharacterized protein n=1 Tax=Tumebacillus flagellatus TaxID=1157490 RepID=A0A074LV83_9BACL|nr:hypothetical protein [Tumebacillus flagellatus]KEO83888.1 hypothetical protein EL26_08210 [Tumebacillus flagellatus]
MQINVNFIKSMTFDKSFITIGPTIQTVVRARENQNYGLGEVVGDRNEVFGAKYAVSDDDVFDFLTKKIVIHK